MARRALLLALSLVCVGALGKSYPAHWLSFRSGAIAVLQGRGDSYSGYVSWAPRKQVGKYTLRGELGFSALRKAQGNLFTLFSADALVGAPVWKRLGLEGGVGASAWIGNGGARPQMTVGLNYGPFSPKSRFSQIYLGYSHIFFTPSANLVKAGVTVSLDPIGARSAPRRR